MPRAIAVMAIFIIGADILLLWSLAVMRRFAIKYSNFNGMISNSVFKNTVLFSVLLMVACSSQKGQEIRDKAEAEKQNAAIKTQNARIITGAENTDAYLPLLKDKKVGIVTNQTGILSYVDQGTINDKDGKPNGGWRNVYEARSIVDFLSSRTNLQKIFAPEHGFRGTADAGEHVVDGKDTKTGLPIVSLYGDNKKPKA